VERMVADFYEVPRDRLGELRDAAQGSRARLGRNREHWNAMLSSLRRPVPRYESPHYFLAAVLGVVGDSECWSSTNAGPSASRSLSTDAALGGARIAYQRTTALVPSGSA
jgi:hypothetical protein